MDDGLNFSLSAPLLPLRIEHIQVRLVGYVEHEPTGRQIDFVVGGRSHRPGNLLRGPNLPESQEAGIGPHRLTKLKTEEITNGAKEEYFIAMMVLYDIMLVRL